MKEGEVVIICQKLAYEETVPETHFCSIDAPSGYLVWGRYLDGARVYSNCEAALKDLEAIKGYYWMNGSDVKDIRIATRFNVMSLRR